ncbi:MAG: tRNA pseudouridine(55) synthase TruB [Oscillospiraceae bacterium]|jgi:tRNA pseudouridine55 synthase|nr:tRNA pseudouridine(55) synthase TruB [Oscillospiraceae bacterium]
MSEISGVVPFYKESGVTSFTAMRKVSRLFGAGKAGHAGTLDPLAEGVLPILLGGATKAADFLPDNTKEYAADFMFGIETDTEDITGKVLANYDKLVTETELRDVLPRFVGELTQKPPMYSAVKVGGKKLYELARQGKEIEREPRSFTVYSLNLLSYDSNAGKLLVSCAKGTYIRTLIADIAKALGTGGVMTALVRTKSGGIDASQCKRLAELESLSLEQAVIPLEQMFSGLPRLQLDERQTYLWRNGVKFSAEVARDVTTAVFSSENRLFGLVNGCDETLRIVQRFNTN